MQHVRKCVILNPTDCYCVYHDCILYCIDFRSTIGQIIPIPSKEYFRHNESFTAIYCFTSIVNYMLQCKDRKATKGKHCNDVSRINKCMSNRLNVEVQFPDTIVDLTFLYYF